MTKENLEKLCVWKGVANRDNEKRASGEGSITLQEDQKCYKCDGTEAYAKSIKCGAYAPEKN